MRETIDLDVIVVGGGLSGLTAAYTLLERVPTLKVLVLESSGKTTQSNAVTFRQNGDISNRTNRRTIIGDTTT